MLSRFTSSGLLLLLLTSICGLASAGNTASCHNTWKQWCADTTRICGNEGEPCSLIVYQDGKKAKIKRSDNGKDAAIICVREGQAITWQEDPTASATAYFKLGFSSTNSPVDGSAAPRGTKGTPVNANVRTSNVQECNSYSVQHCKDSNPKSCTPVDPRVIVQGGSNTY
ncbi:MAG TPA: hypothetical protein VFB04_01045 [Terriglobales bacterium]|nr:hypothetical protein [Terriglobales bacterium]